jgi:hypothetical protein
MKDTEKTLDTPLNMSVKGGFDNKAVVTYLEVISNNSSEKNLQIAKNKAIQELLESTFEVSNPSGTQKIPSQRLYQALWRVQNRMKPLDFMIHGTGQPQYKEKIVSDGVSTVMDRGGYDSALRDKNGAFFSLLLYGDATIMVGANDDKKSYAPVLFTPVSIDNVYADVFATGIRNRGNAGSAYRAVAIFSYSWNRAVDLFPKLKEIGGIGKIPREREGWDKELERKYEQEFSMEDEVEIGFGWDISKQNFTVFAGSACTVLEEYNGDDYPFLKKDGTPYIPLLHFICVPSSEGFYNHGVGDLLYKLAIVSGRLLNMEVGHAEDNTYPITIVSTPQAEASNFFAKLATAHKQRAAGKKPFVVLERDPNDSNDVQAKSLTTQNLTNEWQLIYNTFLDEIQMLGINLKELTQEGNPTATEILSDEENSQSWVKQVMEYNASESQEAVEITLDCIEEFVSKNSKVPLNLTTKIPTEDGQDEVRADGMNMGMLKTAIKDGDWFVKINSRTGAIPSNTMLRAKIMSVFPLAQPGSPAQGKLAKMMAEIADMDLMPEEFMPQQQEAQATPEAAQADLAAEPISETQRQSFNPRTSKQVAV